MITKFAITTAAFASLLFAGAAASNNNTAHADTKAQFTSVYRVAKTKLGARYVYGSEGSRTFDCSGFTKYIYSHSLGVNLPRTAQQQYHYSKKVSKKHLKKGDLVFIGSSKNSIYHVGMYIGGGKMIDAQNRGVIRENIHAPWWHVVAYGRVA
ncbi:NlpC/P60 family protein [Apilactobacillus kunkeei]|nr:NlpC/P60 family protein [Apilactobacillus kunkeei]MCK8634413.1 NlpC/P60 family protein [Apilactobacillus kunkeei]